MPGNPDEKEFLELPDGGAITRRMNLEILQKAANEARGLAIDAVAACKAGHLGLPLGCAEIGAVLYGVDLRINPRQPRWINRDRFVLSAGHGSMFLYAWLHLSGHDLSLEDIRRFRQLHSRTPGHPEFRETEGVECTTGPLGQGVGNAVGMAIAGKMAAERFNTPDHQVLDYKVICLAGDGCLQEGVAAEASSLAAHLGLDNLILIYDSNEVTLDAPASDSQSEDTAARYRAYGFQVQCVDGHDLAAFARALETARHPAPGHPQLIIARTEIARGIPEVAGTWKGHGEGGVRYADSARAGLGLPADKRFHVSAEVRACFEAKLQERVEAHQKWEASYRSWAAACPDRARELEAGYAGERPTAEEALSSIPIQDKEKPVATRVSGGIILNALAARYPLMVSGSADLHGSTKNYLDGAGDFTARNRSGRNLRYGIREHAMGAILNGFAYDGLWISSGATFFTFSDYMRPSVRLAGLAGLPVTYIWTHDSVSVGVDGPTHQPVETVSGLRLIPNLDLLRPADNEETAGAWAAALSRKDGPTALVLTRQDVPSLSRIPAEIRRTGTLRGAYVARPETSPLECILIATGSELLLALEAAERLGPGTRVVSMPCAERFERQPEEYRQSVLPPSCRRRVAVEAGSTAFWHKYTGLDGIVIGIDRFGLSAPGEQVMAELGVTTEAIVDAARKLAASCC